MSKHNQQHQHRPNQPANQPAPPAAQQALPAAPVLELKPAESAPAEAKPETSSPAAGEQSNGTAAAEAPSAPGRKRKVVVLGDDPEPRFTEITPNDILALIKSYASAVGLRPEQVAAISIAIVTKHGAALEAIAAVFPPVPD